MKGGSNIHPSTQGRNEMDYKNIPLGINHSKTYTSYDFKEWRVPGDPNSHPMGLFEPSTDKFFIRSNTLAITRDEDELERMRNKHPTLGSIKVALREGILYYDISWIIEYYKLEGKESLQKQLEGLLKLARSSA